MSNVMNFCVPCLFGLEGLAADELRRLGTGNVRAENGRVMFEGSAADIARANVNLRTGERVLLKIGQTQADTFDMLFEGVRAMLWEDYIQPDAAFPVKGYSRGSKLHSIPDCQSIIKKAIVRRLTEKHKTELLSETGVKYQIQFAIVDDVAELYIDTSGAGLHKRGYRLAGNAAPLRETLAAAIVKLSRYRGREAVCDPFCGSGTIVIEAALAALNRAPGLAREFDAKAWPWVAGGLWKAAAEEAKAREFNGSYEIIGGDIDPKSIEAAEENARRAGVSDIVRFSVADAAKFKTESPGGIIMTNPPYGERVMLPAEAEEISRRFGAAMKDTMDWSMYILSANSEFERVFGRKATKKRKLYNGMIKCDLYMYY